MTLDNIQYSTAVANYNTASVNPVALDTAVVAGFSSTVSGSDITMNSSGLITINTTGIYAFSFNLNFGRTNTTGNAYILARLLINDVQFGFTQGVVLNTSNDSRPVRIDIILNLTAADVLKVEIMRDSVGANDGGLIATAVTDATWGDIPSWFVRGSRIVGAV